MIKEPMFISARTFRDPDMYIKDGAEAMKAALRKILNMELDALT